MKIAVVFLTTDQNHFNLVNVLNLAKLSKLHQIDVFPYIDLEYEDKKGFIFFTYNYLKSKFNYQVEFKNNQSSVKNKAGILFLTLLDTYVNNKGNYDFYLFWEDDLCYFGNKNFFDSIDFSCDFLFLNKREFPQKSYHWTNPKRCHLTNWNAVYNGYLHIWGGKDLDIIINSLKDNAAHMEVLVNTVVLNSNKKINYINDYMDCAFSHLPIPNLKYHELIHPIKTLEIYNSIQNDIHKIV